MSRESASSTPQRFDRIPPHSEEAEKGVLGSVLLDPAAVMDLCIESQIDAESFYVPVHRAIYEAMLTMHTRSSVIDIVTLGEALKAVGKLESVGGQIFIERLIDSTPTAAHASYYIDIVHQKHLLRKVITCARESESECYTSQESAMHILSETEQRFFSISDRQHGAAVDWPRAVDNTMKHINFLLENRKGLNGLSTGLANLDKVLQGLKPSEMIVLAARPSMGKTSLAMNIVESLALGNTPDKTPRSVGIFSLEMSQESLALRMLASNAGVSAFRVSSGSITNLEFRRLTQAVSILGKAPIVIDDASGLDILELRAKARRMRKRHNVELIVVDYLQLLHSKEFTRQGRQVETADISGNLKAMAKELKVPVLVLSQLNRAPDKSEEGKPRLSDLRDSGAIEQDADVVLLLRRPCKSTAANDRDKGDETLAIVDVAKHRNGPTDDDIRFTFKADLTRFEARMSGYDTVAQAAAVEQPTVEPDLSEEADGE